jgi:hypothetical protein
MTTEQVKAIINLTIEIAHSIKELSEHSPLGGVPSGHLYAALMHQMSLEDYQQIIRWLKDSGCVRETPSHLLDFVEQSGVGQSNSTN